MDADLLTALGPNPTANEKLYAESIQGTRGSTATWTESQKTWTGDISNVQAYRAAIITFTKWVQTQYAKLPPEIFDNNDELYERCVMKGLDLRKQNLTTSSSQTTMDDVINDGFKIGGEIFRRIQARKALIVAKQLTATAVPPDVL